MTNGIFGPKSFVKCQGSVLTNNLRKNLIILYIYSISISYVNMSRGGIP